MVCVVEKGHVNVEVSVRGNAGHSSIPPPSSTIGALCKAVAALEAAPHPPRLLPALHLFTALLPAMPFLPRLLFSNAWLFSPLLTRILLASPSTAALLRTTTAVTLISGGVKSNVLPPSATAVVNRRIHPGDTVAGVLARDTAVCAAALGSATQTAPHNNNAATGLTLTLRALEALEPSPVASTSPSNAPGWRAISSSLRSCFHPPPLVAPGLMLGNTDTRWFWGCSENIYRHCPTELTMEETKMFHGKNERVRTGNLARLCAFYETLLREAAR